MPVAPHITQGFARPSYRPEQPTGLDPEMKRMALMAAGFGTLVALVLGAVSLSHHVHRGIPVLSPPAGPVRVKPADPGGMKVAGAEEDAAPGAEALAPAPETPQIGALHAREMKPEVVATAAPAPVAQPAAAVVPVARAVEPAAASPAVGGTYVQLAAFDSEASAQQEWQHLQLKMPGLFDGHKPEYARASLAGRTLYRLRTGGFADMAAATEFCEQVRAKGGDCSIAAF